MKRLLPSALFTHFLLRILSLLIFFFIVAGSYCCMAQCTITTQPTNTTKCSGDTASFKVVSDGTVFQWQVDTGTGFQDITSSGISPVYSGYNLNILQLNSVLTKHNSYKYICKVSGSPCISEILTDTAKIIVDSIPNTPGSISGTASVCPGTTEIYNILSVPNAITYTWKVPTGWAIVSGQGTLTLTVTTGSAGQNGSISVKASNICGTSGAALFPVVVSATAPVKPGIISGTAAVCPGTSNNYSITSVPGATSYSWMAPLGWNITSGQTSTAITVTAGTASQNGFITVSSNNFCGSSSPSSLYVTVSPAIPSLPSSITGLAASCPATSNTYNITPVPNATNYAWIVPVGWTITNGQGTTSITVTTGTPGQNGNISVSASNSCGSSIATLKAVSIYIPPSISNHPADKIVCEGTDTSFSVTATGTALTYQWQVSGDGGNTYNNITCSGSSNPTYTGCITNTLNLSNIINGNNGLRFRCSINGTCTPQAISNSALLTVNQNLPVSVIAYNSGSSSICQGTDITFMSVPNNGGSNPSYQWYNGSNIISGATSALYSTSSLPVGSNSITCIVTSNATCATGNPATSNTISIQVNSLVQPSVNISAVPIGAICQGTSVTFTATPSNGGSTPTFQWFINGTNIGVTSSSYTNSVLTNGDIISCELTSNVQCPSINSVTSNAIIMQVNSPLPVGVSITANPLGAVCQGTSITFTATPANGGSIPAYQWLKNGIDIGATGSTFTSNSLLNGDIVSCVLTSNATCILGNPATSNSMTITVNPIPLIIINPVSATICTGTSIDITAFGASSYAWSPANSLNASTGNTVTASPATNTTYTIVGSDNGCTNTANILITVNSLPNANAGQNQTICAGESATLKASGGDYYLWNNGLAADSIIVIPSITTTYTVIVTKNGCTASANVIVTVNPLPVVNAGNAQTICDGQSATFTVANGDTYLWSPGGQITGSITVYPSATTTYTVTVSKNGCTASDDVILTVNPLPAPHITGETIVCTNSYWIEYQTPLTGNGFTWEIKGGEIQTGFNTSNVYVHWTKNTKGTIYVTEHVWATGCEKKDSLLVNMNGSTSGEIVKVIAKSNNINTNILICPDSLNCYKWGYESKTDHHEIYTCSSNNWCQYSHIDTMQYYYWVRIGCDTACTTKSYFNAPLLSGLNEDNAISSINIYPNPTSDYLNYEIRNMKNEHFVISLHSLLGKKLYSKKITTFDNYFIGKLDLTEIKQGVYFLMIEDGIGNKFVRKIIKM